MLSERTASSSLMSSVFFRVKTAPKFFPMGLETALAALVASASCVLAQPGCQTQTRYNPIAEQHPDSITGVMNGTFALAFIPRDTADTLLPEGFEFLGEIYQDNVELWQQDAFPVLVKAVRIHDIRAPDDVWRNDHTVYLLLSLRDETRLMDS